jgi:hypothetical protein
MNRLLCFKGTSLSPDYQLSMPERADKAHDIAMGKGLSKTHLMNLLELTWPTGSPETDGGGGCHRGGVSEP